MAVFWDCPEPEEETMMKILAGLAVVIGALIWGSVLAVWATGVVVVEVDEKSPKGQHLYLPVPVILAHAAIALTPDEHLREARTELVARKDLVMAACKELSRCPDTMFVEYKSPNEHVTVRKEGDTFKVLADTEDTKVRVSVPIRSVRNLVSQLAD
jgi:hypothetical protein